MPFFRRTLVALAAALTLAPARSEDAAKPFLWRIEGAKPGYIFGTIHLTSKDVATLAPATKAAVDACDVLYTEVPMDVAGQMKAAMALMGGGQPLSESVPKDLYARAEAELKRVNPALTLEPFQRMKVWALAVTIALIEEQMKNPGGMPLDAILYAKAEQAGKVVGGIETIEEQMAVFEKFSPSEQVEMLRATLDDMDRARKDGRSPIAEIRTAYLTGDLGELEKTTTEWMKGLNADLLKRFTDELLTKRNHVMAERMVAKLRAAPEKSLFFAVGAAHLVGEEGVLNLLEKQGYKLKRVSNP